MNETLLVSIALGVIAGVFGVLMAVLGWIGNRIYSKVEEIAKTIHAMKDELHDRITITKDSLNGDIRELGERISKLEAVESVCPYGRGNNDSKLSGQ